MTQWLVIIQVILISLGLVLLLYYARFRHKILTQDVLHSKKIRLPFFLKVYALLLFVWFGFLLVELVRALF